MKFVLILYLMNGGQVESEKYYAVIPKESDCIVAGMAMNQFYWNNYGITVKYDCVPV